MKHIFFTLMMGLSLLLSSTAMAEGVDKQELKNDSLDAVITYLVASDFMVSRSTLNRIDTDPVPELITVATDRRKKSLVRERAIKSLSLYRDARVQRAFRDMVSTQPNKYFNVIVMAYLEAFGEDAVKDIEPLLESKKANVRLTVVQALGIFGGQPGFELLQAKDKTEEDPKVLAKIRSYIQ